MLGHFGKEGFMPHKTSVRRLMGVLLLVAAIGASPAGAVAQDKELEEMARKFVAIVIPAADQNFEILKREEKPQYFAGPPIYFTKFYGPEGWSTEIKKDHSGATFSCFFQTYHTRKDKLWFYAQEGGNLLIPMYKTIRGILSELLKSGWKRKSEEDHRWSKDDPNTGSRTYWTRQDGLVVTLARIETWNPDKDYDKQRKVKLLKDVDPSYLPDLDLYLSVRKRKGNGL